MKHFLYACAALFAFAGMTMFSACDDDDHPSEVPKSKEFAYYVAFVDTTFAKYFDVEILVEDRVLTLQPELSAMPSLMLSSIPGYFSERCGTYYIDSLTVEAQVRFKANWREVLDAQPDSLLNFYSGYAFATAAFEKQARTQLAGAHDLNLKEVVRNYGEEKVAQSLALRFRRVFHGYEPYESGSSGTITVVL